MSSDDAEAQPDIAELLERWRVERLADGSVRVKGERSSWWSLYLLPMGCAWVGLGLIVVLYMSDMWKRSEADREPIKIAFFVVTALIVTLAPLFSADRGAWLTLSAWGLRVDTVWPLGVRTFRRLPWEQIKGLTLVSPILDREMWFDLEAGGKLVIPSARLPTPPIQIWDWALTEVALPERVRELVAAEIRRVRGMAALDNRTMAGAPNPLGPSLLENSPGCVRVRGRGLAGASLVVGLIAVPLGALVFPGLVLLDSRDPRELLTACSLLGAGMLGVALAVVICAAAREEITATPDGLRVARRSLLGTRVRTLDRRPDSIGLPESWWVWLLWPHLVVTSEDLTLRLGSALEHQQLHWLLARLQALWGLTSPTLDGPAREER